MDRTRRKTIKNLKRNAMVWAAGVAAAAALVLPGELAAASAAGRLQSQPEPQSESRTNPSAPYRVLAPIESGNLLLFPVVETRAGSGEAPSLLTLDEGIKSGDVEITEAGKAQGLVRPRGPAIPFDGNRFRSDQVNTLVLVNHSRRPLLLLAGEIVTGGKQDRVIAKDRIVPAGSEPIDLSVFCIEPGRWTETSPRFSSASGGADKSLGNSFMVQPAVRRQAMVAADQQQVWNAVGGAISGLAGAPPASRGASSQLELDGRLSTGRSGLGTTSYAKAMQEGQISAKVDEAAAPALQWPDKGIEALRRLHAVGVVAAVRGEIIWADIFANTDLLSRYWTKLVRSYAAESLNQPESGGTPSVADAQRFIDAPVSGTETSNGEIGVYRLSEIKSIGTDTFVLESLLGAKSSQVHTSKLKLKEAVRRAAPSLLR